MDHIDKVRLLPTTPERVETGAVQFGDDWPGLFLRGDECLLLSQEIGLLSGLYGERAYGRGLIALGFLEYIKKIIDEDVIIRAKDEGEGEG